MHLLRDCGYHLLLSVTLFVYSVKCQRYAPQFSIHIQNQCAPWEMRLCPVE